jgi:hypothetical protein
MRFLAFRGQCCFAFTPSSQRRMPASLPSEAGFAFLWGHAERTAQSRTAEKGDWLDAYKRPPREETARASCLSPFFAALAGWKWDRHLIAAAGRSMFVPRCSDKQPVPFPATLRCSTHRYPARVSRARETHPPAAVAGFARIQPGVTRTHKTGASTKLHLRERQIALRVER